MSRANKVAAARVFVAASAKSGAPVPQWIRDIADQEVNRRRPARAVRQRMAWEYILENKDSLNLDQHNIKVAESRVAQAKQTVADSIREAYRWIVVPTQEPGSSEVELESILMNGDGTLAERVTKKADAGEFVVRSFSPSLLRMQINRLNLWKDKPYVPVDTVVGYFSQYVYMPKVVQPKVVMDVVWHLNEVLSIELDGFAYADSYEDGRFVGLTVTNPTAVRQGGLLVDPKVALELIAKDTSPRTRRTPRGLRRTPTPRRPLTRRTRPHPEWQRCPSDSRRQRTSRSTESSATWAKSTRRSSPTS